MNQKIDIDLLTTCVVTPNGARIRLNFENIAGHATTLELSTPLVQQLVNTLPHLLSTALRLQHGDNCARDPQDSIAWALQ